MTGRLLCLLGLHRKLPADAANPFVHSLFCCPRCGGVWSLVRAAGNAGWVRVPADQVARRPALEAR